MTNTKLIEATMKEIETFFKLEGFPLTLDLKTSFKAKVENWYNHTEIADAETLRQLHFQEILSRVLQ